MGLSPRPHPFGADLEEALSKAERNFSRGLSRRRAPRASSVWMKNGPMRHVGPPMLCVAAAFAMAHSVERIRATYSVLAPVAARLFSPSLGKLPKL